MKVDTRNAVRDWVIVGCLIICSLLYAIRGAASGPVDGFDDLTPKEKREMYDWIKDVHSYFLDHNSVRQPDSNTGNK